MPELPDVQVFKEYLDATSLHQVIREVEIFRRDILGGVSSRSLKRRLKGKRLESTWRHGKFLFVRIGDDDDDADDDGWLVLHFGMTGLLEYSKSKNPPEHTRLLLHFEDGAHLAYICMRLLGLVDWTNDAERFVQDKELGIDALGEDLDFEQFSELIGAKQAAVKSALMDQETIAGLGNVYVDEILFQARVHPKTRAARLSEKQLREIFQQLRRVLKAAIRARAQPKRMPKSFLLYRRGENGAKCPRCGSPFQSTKVSGRTSYFCSRCQQP